MGRSSQRDLRNRALEDDPIVGQCIESWRLNLGVAVAAKMVGSNSVNGNQEYVRLAGASCRVLDLRVNYSAWNQAKKNGYC